MYYISHDGSQKKQSTNHKYYERVQIGLKDGHAQYRYFYTKEEYDAYMRPLRDKIDKDKYEQFEKYKPSTQIKEAIKSAPSKAKQGAAEIQRDLNTAKNKTKRNLNLAKNKLQRFKKKTERALKQSIKEIPSKTKKLGRDTVDRIVYKTENGHTESIGGQLVVRENKTNRFTGQKYTKVYNTGIKTLNKKKRNK